jgi:hypothetical protein
MSDEINRSDEPQEKPPTYEEMRAAAQAATKGQKRQRSGEVGKWIIRIVGGLLALALLMAVGGWIIRNPPRLGDISLPQPQQLQPTPVGEPGEQQPAQSEAAEATVDVDRLVETAVAQTLQAASSTSIPEEPPSTAEPPTLAPTTAALMPCPSVNAAVDALGLNVSPLPEPCGFKYEGSIATVRCSTDWICTLALTNGNVYVYLGDNAQYDIYAGTFRYIPAYPVNDAVHNACQLLEKEQEFSGLTVIAGNFSCGEQSVSTTPLERSRQENLEYLSEIYQSEGLEAWLRGAGMTFDSVTQLMSEPISGTAFSNTAVTGIQIMARNLSVPWPACMDTDQPVDIGTDTRRVEPYKYTNVTGFTGPVTVWIDCRDVAALYPD